jgi:hypothetical protein
MRVILLSGLSLFAAGAASAANCDDYPNSIGINIEDVQGGTKIVATAGVSVSFDDVDSVNDARDEATLEAKAMISKFMSEGIKSVEQVKRAVQETKSMQGDAKDALRKEVIERVKILSNSSQALLRGAVPLGSCYTKGREFRMSVGIKPETIKSAGNLAAGIAGTNPTPSGAGPSNAQPLKNVDGYSDTTGLKNF